MHYPGRRLHTFLSESHRCSVTTQTAQTSRGPGVIMSVFFLSDFSDRESSRYFAWCISHARLGARISPMDFLLCATRGSMRRVRDPSRAPQFVFVHRARPLLSRSDRRGDLSSTRRDRDPARTQDVGRKEEMKHPPTTVMAGDQPKSKARKKKRKKFAWKVVDFAACSKECGGGESIINCAS